MSKMWENGLKDPMYCHNSYSELSISDIELFIMMNLMCEEILG